MSLLARRQLFQQVSQVSKLETRILFSVQVLPVGPRLSEIQSRNTYYGPIQIFGIQFADMASRLVLISLSLCIPSPFVISKTLHRSMAYFFASFSFFSRASLTCDLRFRLPPSLGPLKTSSVFFAGCEGGFLCRFLRALSSMYCLRNSAAALSSASRVSSSMTRGAFGISYTSTANENEMVNKEKEKKNK